MSVTMDPGVIKETQSTLGAIIQKPPLTDKLLGKPPFRFLHDIIRGVIENTGFTNGAFTPEELNADNVSDRDGKIAFLAKAIKCVEETTGQKLAMKPSKTVAGHDPENTNIFLQELAKAATQGSNKSAGAKSSKTKSKKDHSAENGDVGGTVKKEKRSSSKDKEKRDKSEDKSKDKKSKERSSSKDKEGSKSKGSKEDVPEAKGRSHSKDKTSSKDKESKAKSEEKRSSSKDKDGSTKKEKSSSKDRTSDKAKSRESKKSSKEKTSSKTSKLPIPTVEQNGKLPSPKDDLEEKETTPDLIRSTQEQFPPSDENGLLSPETAKEGVSTPKNSVFETDRPVVDDQRQVHSATVGGAEQPARPPTALRRGAASARPPTASGARPSTARPAPPRLRKTLDEQPGEKSINSREGSARVINAATTSGSREGSAVTISGGSSATANPAIITDDSKKAQEDDAFIVEDNEGDVEDEDMPKFGGQPGDPLQIDKTVDADNLDADEHGGLVRKILETKKDLEEHDKGHDAQQQQQKAGTLVVFDEKEREKAIKDTGKIQTCIQKLTRSSHPLGKTMDFLQEDVDSMVKELEAYKAEFRENWTQIRQQEAMVSNDLEPLRRKLTGLDQQIAEQREKTSGLKTSLAQLREKQQTLVINLTGRKAIS